MPRHPNKHIQAAIEYAESQGWSFTLSNGHAFGIIRCGAEDGTCQKSVWSTPRRPEDHAKQILRYVKKCRCDQPFVELDEPEE